MHAVVVVVVGFMRRRKKDKVKVKDEGIAIAFQAYNLSKRKVSELEWIS